MKLGGVSLFAAFVLGGPVSQGQSAVMTVPKSILAGSPVSIPTTGSGGNATLFLVGPGQALRRDLRLGETAAFPAGVLFNAGHYLAILAGGASTETAEFDVAPVPQPATLNFLAKPSRLPVGMRNGISGAVYIFDIYNNLITTPIPVSLDLASSSGTVQSRSVPTRHGLAWAEMDSANRQGTVKFTARAGNISSLRVIDQVPGDPCSLTITARGDGNQIEVQTAPVRDCSGNPVPDGTIVTFTETLNGVQATADVPIKQGTARVHMPAYPGARIAAASGVVAGNEIRWGGGR